MSPYGGLIEARTATAESDQWTDYLPILFPFAAAILLWLVAPLITTLTKNVVSGQIAREMYKHDEILWLPLPTPYKQIDDYIELAADAVQVIPAVSLPVIGALVAAASKVSTITALLVAFMLITVLITAICWIFSRSAPDYASSGWGGYSVVTIVGIFSNAAAIAIIIYFGV